MRVYQCSLDPIDAFKFCSYPKLYFIHDRCSWDEDLGINPLDLRDTPVRQPGKLTRGRSSHCTRFAS